MKKLNLIVILIFVFAVLGFAQTNKAESVAKKVLINKNAFDNKDSEIPQLVQAYDKLELEFEPQETEIKELHKKYKELWNFISAPQNGIKLTNVALAQLPTKKNKFRKIECKIKQKQEIAKMQYEKRYSEVIKPIFDKINLVMKEFAEQKDYEIIDIETFSKDSFYSSGLFDPDWESLDKTSEFIKFYNNYLLTNKPQ